ncbi:MAG: hypothetical protein ACRDJM_10025, partial [Actinomycetota bacterium]
ASFMRYLDRRFGSNAGARAYQALGTIDPVTSGTWRYHLDRVLQKLFGRSYPDVEREWFRSITQELS